MALVCKCTVVWLTEWTLYDQKPAEAQETLKTPAIATNGSVIVLKPCTSRTVQFPGFISGVSFSVTSESVTPKEHF
jgi:hypothetical protein